MILAACVRVALAELLLPSVNVFLQTGARFDYWQDPALLEWLAIGVMVLSVCAGLYAAMILSSFRPASALKGIVTHLSRAAVGKLVPDASTENPPREIIGVIPDFSLASVEQAIGPTVYDNHKEFGLIDVKLTGQSIPETLAALDELWPQLGLLEAPPRYFLNDRLQQRYASMLRLAQAFGAMSLVAVLLACLGLIGLSAAATDRRTKEIGIRKALGAGSGEIVRLLMWQFTKPVIWAAVLAWPIGAWLMSRWLNGFAYHVDLTPLPFIAATVAALALALLTVSIHSYSVARIQPVAALRYE